MSIYSQIIDWEVLLLEQQKEYEEALKKDKPFGIIYRVTNLINGKVYIGQTRQGLSIRKAHHIRDHNNKSHESIVLYKAFRKYGLESFKWEAIDTAADVTELNEKEIEWIEIHGANKGKGYNMTAGGQGVRGYIVTEEGIQRRKDALNRMWANGHAATLQSGEAHARAVFTNDQVKEIVQHFIKRDLNEHELAEKYNTTTSNIYGIKSRKSYKYQISDEEVIKMNEYRQGDKRKVNDFTEDEMLNLKNMLLNSDLITTKIYKLFDISVGQMSHILYQSKWKYLFTEEEVKLIRNRKVVNTLTKEEVVKIKEMLEDGLYRQIEIAAIFNLRSSYVNSIAHEKKWSSVLIDLPMEDIEVYDWKPIVGIIKNKT